MMKKIATVAVLAMAATQVEAACAENWITTANSLAATGNSGAAYTGDTTSWNYCASIRAGGNSCCTSTMVNTFQTKADTLVDTLKTSVTTRDQYIMDRRGDVLNVRDSLNSIQESITKIAADSSISVSDTLEAFFTGYDDTIQTFTEDFDDLKAAFVTYQTNRQTCFNKLVQAQIAVWCAACTEDPATAYGFDTTNSAVSFGTTFTTAVAGACSAYIASSIEQSQILSLYYVSDYLETLADALNKLANGDATGAATALAEFFTDYTGITAPTDNLKKVASSVGTCTTTSCDWASNSLLGTGTLVTDLAVVGGAYPSSRLLQEFEAPAGRMLTFDLDPATESRVTVDFPQNPGNVDNDQNSAVRNGAIACAITALAALL